MRRALASLAMLAAMGTMSAAGAAQAPLAPQPLGRLFFTPAERAQLDVARMQKKPPPQQAAAEAPEPAPASQTVTYGGIVRRSDGKAMLWINNRLVEEKEALSSLNLKGRVRPDGAMTVQTPQTGGSVDLKVGQSVDVQTGRVGETKRPPPEQKPPPPEEPASPAADAKPPADAKPAAKPIEESPVAKKGDAPAVPAGNRSDQAGSAKK